MMRIYLAILFFAAGVGISPAQTNSDTNTVPAVPMVIQTNSSTNVMPSETTIAKTNSPAAPVPKKHLEGNKPAPGPTIINADGFDMTQRMAIYERNVVVTNLQMKLTCEWLIANLPSHGEHVTNAVAETNVVVDLIKNGQPIHVTGQKGVYYFHVENGVTNETITLTGTPQQKPEIQQPQGSMKGDKIIWDVVGGSLHVDQPESVGNDTNTPAGTNSLVPKTTLF
jgi:lipopolysaccharide export system protein LptA